MRLSRISLKVGKKCIFLSLLFLAPGNVIFWKESPIFYFVVETCIGISFASIHFSFSIPRYPCGNTSLIVSSYNPFPAQLWSLTRCVCLQTFPDAWVLDQAEHCRRALQSNISKEHLQYTLVKFHPIIGLRETMKINENRCNICIYTNIRIKFQIFCVLDSDSLENLPILNYLKSSVAESFVLEILKSILLLPGTRLLYNGIVIIISASSYDISWNIIMYH